MSAMKTYARFSHRFQATEAATHDTMIEIIAWLGAAGLSKEQTSNVEIALTEAVNNVVEHAYSKLTPGNLDVEGSFEHDFLIIRLRDQGRMLTNALLPAGKPPKLTGPRESLPEGGFGWFLIRSLTKEVVYERKMDNNYLTLTFELFPSAT